MHRMMHRSHVGDNRVIFADRFAALMFILDTDASDHSIGAVLSQVQDGAERVISYGSYHLHLSRGSTV